MLNIIIFGAPGAGKGTQAQKLAAALNLKHISTGKLLREEVLKNSDIGKEVKSIISQGSLVSDRIVDQIVKNQILENGSHAGFIFDGYPRNITQAENLDKFLTKISLPIILNLKVNTNALIQRLLLRGIDSNRPDDNETTIKYRLNIYTEQTEPLLAFYGKQNRVIDIDGEGSVDEVYQRLITQIKNLNK